MDGSDRTGSRRPDQPEASRLVELLQEAERLALPPGSGIARVRRQLAALIARLQEGRLQVAVVGQFKRGKSTLLNALIGAELLPSAVTPLTAIPTFLRAGASPALTTLYQNGRSETLHAKQVRDLAEPLAARVTEDGNPENVQAIAQVELYLAAPLLQAHIVLIDTPGIGSTYRHNTDVAKATLPECDAALFVVSPDPPITEVEIGYLHELKAITPSITIVLNKIDLVEDADKARSEGFLAKALAAAGITVAGTFSLSARQALRGRVDGNSGVVAASGLPALEAALLDLAQAGHRDILPRASARKAGGLIEELAFETDAHIAAREMPIEALGIKLAQFTEAERDFSRERIAVADLMAGDRKRLLSQLDDEAASCRKAVTATLSAAVLQQIAEGAVEADILAELERTIPPLFAQVFDAFAGEARRQIEALLTVHQERGDALIARVRRAAAELLDIPYRAPASAEAFESKRIPYFVTAPRESLVSAGGFLDSLLPRHMRRKRLSRRLVARIDEVAIRNVENLRWATRQNLEDAIRGFQDTLDARLQSAQAATREAIAAALAQRTALGGASEASLSSLKAARHRLETFAAELAAMA